MILFLKSIWRVKDILLYVHFEFEYRVTRSGYLRKAW